MSGLPVPGAAIVIAMGVLTFAALVVQLLIGYRKIKFQGRTHMKVHRAVAWTMLGLAVVHAIVAAIYLGIGPF